MWKYFIAVTLCLEGHCGILQAIGSKEVSKGSVAVVALCERHVGGLQNE